jgi:hypothetical protein
LREHYRLYCKTLTKVITAAKKLYYDRRIINSKNKSKTIWNIIKTETGKRDGKEDIKLLNIQGNITSDQQVLANNLNDYFLTIVDIIIDSSSVTKTGQPIYDKFLNYMSPKSTGLLPNIRVMHTTTHEIEGIMKSLKAKYSFGYNEIPVAMLQESAPFISSPLAYIVNKSLSSGNQ